MNTVQLECFVSARCDAKFRQYANDPNFNRKDYLLRFYA